MNIEKVKRAIYLQKKANEQIDIYGESSADVMDELITLADEFSPEENDMFIKMYE